MWQGLLCACSRFADIQQLHLFVYSEDRVLDVVRVNGVTWKRLRRYCCLVEQYRCADESFLIPLKDPEALADALKEQVRLDVCTV